MKRTKTLAIRMIFVCFQVKSGDFTVKRGVSLHFERKRIEFQLTAAEQPHFPPFPPFSSASAVIYQRSGKSPEKASIKNQKCKIL